MKKIYVLFLIPLILYVGLLGIMPQMEPDEARYSLIAGAMNESGNYVTPHIKNIIYLEKPPLVSWVTAISFKIFGENDFSARLFAALCAWGCILLVYFMGKHFRDERAGLYAAAVLTISSFHFALGHINILDMPLTFFICLSVWLGYIALEKQSQKYLFYLFYLACALTFLTKGLIGVVFPFAILIVWLAATGRWRRIPALFSPVGILIFLIVVCPWLILAQRENPDFLYFFFIREHFLRFTTKMHGKTEPVYYYLPILIAGTIPWCVYLIKSWRKDIRDSFFTRDINMFLIIWLLFIFVFYTASSSKLATYIAPVFIPIALFAGCLFNKYENDIPEAGYRWKNVAYRVAVIFQSGIVIIALLLPPILKQYSDPEKGLVVMTSDLWWVSIFVPAIAIILLTFLPDLMFRRFRKGWFLSIYILCALFLGGMLFPLNDFLAPYRSAKVVQKAIAEYVPRGQDLYQYRVNFYGIDFYNKIRTPVIEDFGELSEGIVKLAPEEKKRYFLSVKEFIELCALKKDVYCITQHRDRFKEVTTKMPGTDVLWDNGAFYLLHIRN